MIANIKVQKLCGSPLEYTQTMRKSNSNWQKLLVVQYKSQKLCGIPIANSHKLWGSTIVTAHKRCGSPIVTAHKFSDSQY